MRQIIRLTGFSIVAASLLQAENLQLETIEVEETGTTTVVKDVAGEEVRSADLADALYKVDPDVQLIRRSGISNDIIVRGMRKDDINVLIDGGKIYGGCPNRMDPPISHVLSNNVDNIVIKEGPYDVENFGTLTGLVEVNTIKPSEEMQGNIDFNVGSWNYYKLGARFSGGSDRFRLMVGGSTEKGGQYEDGDGNTLADQVDNYTETRPALQKFRFTDQYRDMDAFEKKTGMVKLFVDVTDSQELQLSYTVNQSDDVLYPNTPMDALEDNSNLFNAKYTLRNLGEWSKKVELTFYNSWVYHPMGNYYRSAANGLHGVIENVMNSRIYGGTVKNTMDLYEGELAVGLDASRRTWNGEYRHHDGEYWSPSIDHSKTKDWAVFAEYDKRIDAWDINAGVRYDDASTESDEPGTDKNDYSYLSGYLYTTYHWNETTKIFGGIGSASRVPDGKELYLKSKAMPTSSLIGNPDLDETTNNQIDLGIDMQPFEELALRLKGFYSKLNDFIFYNRTVDKYENQDATLYGISADATYALNDTVYFDGGIAWLRGRKDDPLTDQSDKDMPNIPPLKGTLGANWDFDDTGSMRLSMVAASAWNKYDGDNGERELGGYAVFNFQIRKDFLNHYELTFGVDNILDKTYAITNTYADMTLVTGGEPMLLNEPGRYVYGNLTWHF